jgi:hypothetical protein
LYVEFERVEDETKECNMVFLRVFKKTFLRIEHFFEFIELWSSFVNSVLKILDRIGVEFASIAPNKSEKRITVLILLLFFEN